MNEDSDYWEKLRERTAKELRNVADDIENGSLNPTEQPTVTSLGFKSHGKLQVDISYIDRDGVERTVKIE